MLQADITQEAVEEAYINYFDKFADLAQLRPAGGYRCKIKTPNSPDPQDTLYLFGRTATEPFTYYYRECINPTANKPTWAPWHKIDLNINSDYINAVYAFNKLFIFWVEITQIEKNEQTTAKSNGETKTETKATIKYSFQKVSKEWKHPQTLGDEVVIEKDADSSLWRKVTALPMPAGGLDRDEKILTLFGPLKKSGAASESFETERKEQGIILTSGLVQEKSSVVLASNKFDPLKILQSQIKQGELSIYEIPNQFI